MSGMKMYIRNRIMRRSCLLAVAMLLLAMTIIVGCSDEQSPQDSYDGQMTRYAAIAAKVRGLDPGDIGDVTSSAIASQCFETLYQYHYLKRPYKVIPCLAESMPQISEDGLSYTIKLRQDVYFFDDECFADGKGRQVTVKDFIYAWKRIANIKYLSKNWWIFDGRIVGLDDFREYTKTVEKKGAVDYGRAVAGLKALDDFTLEIRLVRPWPQILYLLAHLPTAPMSREAVEYYGDQIMNVAIGTGPYMLESWERGSRMVMVRNRDYRPVYYPAAGDTGDLERGFLADAGKQLPFIDKIEYTIVEEDMPRWLLFMQGKIDASGIPKDFYNQAVTGQRTLSKDLKEKGIELVIQEDPSTFWYGFNMEDPLVGKNLPLRRAMSCAWNREEFIEVFNNNRGVPAKGVYPPMFKEYEPEFYNPWTQYNTDKARKLLEEAVKLNGDKPISVMLSMPGTDTFSRQMGQYFQRCMDRIGLEVKVDYFDWPTFQDRVKSRSLQIFAMGWVADYPDGETFLQIFYGPNASPGPNNFNYANSEYDELYEKASIMADSPERVAMYRRMERIICDDCVAIFSYHPTAFVPYYKYLKNYKPNVFQYGLTQYHNIDLKQRLELVGR